MKQLINFFIAIVLCTVIPACNKRDIVLPTLTKANLVGSWAGTYTITTPPTISSGYTFTTTTDGKVLIEVKGDNQTSSIKFSGNSITYIGSINIKDKKFTGKYYNTDSVPNIILENVSINTSDSTLVGILKNNLGGSGEVSVKKLQPGEIYVLF